MCLSFLFSCLLGGKKSVQHSSVTFADNAETELRLAKSLTTYPDEEVDAGDEIPIGTAEIPRRKSFVKPGRRASGTPSRAVSAESKEMAVAAHFLSL